MSNTPLTSNQRVPSWYFVQVEEAIRMLDQLAQDEDRIGNNVRRHIANIRDYLKTETEVAKKVLL